MTEQEKRYMEIAMSASEVSIAACQIAQANGYLKKKHAKGRLLDAIVALKEDITYMAAKYKKKMEEGK